MKKFLTDIKDLCVVGTDKYIDSRGNFSRLFCESTLADRLANRRIVQINHSRTIQVGTVRGLHFQNSPNAEMKFVICLRGKVWDVAVDLRRDSSSFLKWHAEELTPENGKMMIIPEGFGHGFQVLASDSELLYFHTAFYNPQAEGGLRFDDPQVAINWPLKPMHVSERDQNFDYIDASFKGCII